MIPLKAKITKLIFLSAVKFPLLFPKWTNETGKYYFGKDSNKPIGLTKNWEVASYFESEMKWKAIGLVCQISHEDLEKIHKWMRKSGSPLSYNEKRDRESFKVNYGNSESYRNIGWLDFGKEKRIMSLAHIEMPNGFSDSCYISISKFSGGLTYLSMYFMLKDSATLAVQKQDVKEIVGYMTFQSLNPFSRRFRITEHHNRENLIRAHLKQNLNEVCTDIKSTAQNLFRNWKIIKSDDDLVLVADFCRNSNEAYFKKAEESPISYKTENHYVMIETWQDYCDLKISDDSSEHYCMLTVIEDTAIDAIFIKNQNPENVDENYVFSNIGLEIHDSHLYFSTIIELTNKYKKVMSFVNLALISKSSEPEENHDVLFKASIELDSIAEQLDSINSATSHYCDKKYIETIRNWIKYRKDETTKQNVIISKRRSFSSDSLQVKNLRFNKTYSLIVGLLVVVQIVLACLTIDWSKYSQLKGELLRKSASLGYCIIHYLNLPSQNIRTTMIATTNINLKVPFNEKDQAKSLGARWNAEAKLWYVPQGVEAAPFEKWVSPAPNSAPNPAPAQAAAKPAAQANKPFADDLDAINASLRDAYESHEDAF